MVGALGRSLCGCLERAPGGDSGSPPVRGTRLPHGLVEVRSRPLGRLAESFPVEHSSAFPGV